MAERRTLTTAINSVPNADPDAVRAFVTQERSAPSLHPHSPGSTNSQRSASTIPSGSAEQPKAKPSEMGNAFSQSPALLQRPVTSSFQPVGLIPITVRLRPEIAGALKRASLERQLVGAEFFSQQEIVERALAAWLSTNGHLNS